MTPEPRVEQLRLVHQAVDECAAQYNQIDVTLLHGYVGALADGSEGLADILACSVGRTPEHLAYALRRRLRVLTGRNQVAAEIAAPLLATLGIRQLTDAVDVKL